MSSTQFWGGPHPATPAVIVIGAGCAGLAAATALAEAGVPVHVFEARPGLGGRATTFRDPITGERIDNGQHVLVGCYTETLAFLRRVGSVERLHRPSTLHVPMIDQTGHRTSLTLPTLPPPLDLIAGVIAWDALSAGDRLSMVRLGLALRRKTSTPNDMTVRQWLERHGQSARLCHMLWEPLALAALNQSIDVAAAGPFLAVMRRMFGPEPGAATILLPAVPLDDLYAHPAAAFLQRAGSAVTTNAPARIVIEDERVIGVRVRDAVTPVSMVISTVPWFALGETIESPPRSLSRIIANASALESSPIVTVNLWLDGEALTEPFVGLPGRTFQWVFDRRRILGHTQTHLSCVASGAESICAAPNAELVETAVRELRSAIPAVANAHVRHSSVVRERRATFSLAPASPPRPGTITPVRGLLLAGDWIDTGLPGTIESAVQSGHEAARAALAFLSDHRLSLTPDN